MVPLLAHAIVQLAPLHTNLGLVLPRVQWSIVLIIYSSPALTGGALAVLFTCCGSSNGFFISQTSSQKLNNVSDLMLYSCAGVRMQGDSFRCQWYIAPESETGYYVDFETPFIYVPLHHERFYSCWATDMCLGLDEIPQESSIPSSSWTQRTSHSWECFEHTKEV